MIFSQTRSPVSKKMYTETWKIHFLYCLHARGLRVKTWIFRKKVWRKFYLRRDGFELFVFSKNMTGIRFLSPFSTPHFYILPTILYFRRFRPIFSSGRILLKHRRSLRLSLSRSYRFLCSYALWASENMMLLRFESSLPSNPVYDISRRKLWLRHFLCFVQASVVSRFKTVRLKSLLGLT